MNNTKKTTTKTTKTTKGTETTYMQRRAMTAAFIHAVKPTFAQASKQIDTYAKKLGMKVKEIAVSEEKAKQPASWNQCAYMILLMCRAEKVTQETASAMIAKWDEMSGYKPTPKAESPKQEAKAEPKATEKAEQVVEQANNAKAEAKTEVAQALKSNEEIQANMGL